MKDDRSFKQKILDEMVLDEEDEELVNDVYEEIKDEYRIFSEVEIKRKIRHALYRVRDEVGEKLWIL